MSISKNMSRPIFLGVLLYDYAKDYMFREAYPKVGLDKLLYTDTDSCKMRYDDFLEWRKEAEKKIVPHWLEVESNDARYKEHSIYSCDSKVFGSFEDEFEDYDGESYDFFCLEKKCWLYKYDDVVDSRFKGVNDKAIYMDMKEITIWVNEVKRVNKQTGEKEIDYAVNQEFGKEVNNYHNANTAKCLKGMNAFNLYEKLYKDKSAYVLTSSFRKITNNNTQAIDSDGVVDYNSLNCLTHQIQLCYMLKKIQL